MRPVAPAVWLSPRGVGALLALALALAVASVLPALVWAVAAGAAAFAAALAADALLGPRRDALHVARRPLPHVAMRREAVATYEVENRGALAVRLVLYETPLPTIDFAVDALVATVPARARATLERPFLARERGSVTFGDGYATVENAIGLLRRRVRFDAVETVRVLPDLAAVERRGALAQRKTLVEAGLRRMRLRGGGTEFESLRAYQRGDAFRAVDWKATAKRGRLMVAQFEAERSQSVVVALDCGRLMTPRIGAQRKFDYALTAALSVARIAQAADDNVGLFAFAATPLLDVAPRRGAAHAAALARAAYDLQPRLEEPDYETTFLALRRRAGKRSLIVLFTDLFDPLASSAVLAGLATLVPRHLVLCVLMNDAAIARALAEPPATPSHAYRVAVAMTLADERAASIATLRARGIVVVDVPAPQLTVALLDAYLDVKSRGRL
jgi:uncharacterized protein (DUF58 family)